MKKILITGGAGFIGSNIAVKLMSEFTNLKIIAFDNFIRLGSELNINRLNKFKIKIIRGDVRNINDLSKIGKVDAIIECSAEPSVLAGYNSSPKYIVDTNLGGMINCLEIARKYNADFIFLSTSRIYPCNVLNNLKYNESKTRYEIGLNKFIPGISKNGISEDFTINGIRSIYGATKLCGELLLNEYINAYKLRGVINRCGVITGPWQMGKIDQGVVVLWIAKHIFNKKLNYIGFNGTGKQVRDILHIDDLYELIRYQLTNMSKVNGKTYNVGGGNSISVSLLELTKLCQSITNNKISIGKITKNREVDIKYYISDTSKVNRETGWYPRIKKEIIVEDIFKWITENKNLLRRILS